MVFVEMMVVVRMVEMMMVVEMMVVVRMEVVRMVEVQPVVDSLLSSPLSLRPGGRLLFRFFLDPNSLTLENTFSLLGFSLVPLLLLGLPLPRQAFAFSRSRACRFWRIRELAIAAARDMFLRGGAKQDCAEDGRGEGVRG